MRTSVVEVLHVVAGGGIEVDVACLVKTITIKSRVIHPTTMTSQNDMCPIVGSRFFHIEIGRAIQMCFDPLMRTSIVEIGPKACVIRVGSIAGMIHPPRRITRFTVEIEPFALFEYTGLKGEGAG